MPTILAGQKTLCHQPGPNFQPMRAHAAIGQRLTGAAN
jgi:hypothetical protein